MKRIISALLSATLLAGVAAMPAAAAETYSLGDVTMDGVVDLADAIDLMQYYTGAVVLSTAGNLTEDQLALSDVNKDGSTEIEDAAWVLHYYTHTILNEKPMTSEEYFAQMAVDVQTYTPGDVNMDGVIDAIDCAEVHYAFLIYAVYGKEIPHWTAEQLALADISDRYETPDAKVNAGKFNFYDLTLLNAYCEYTILVPDGVSPEEFYLAAEDYVTEGMYDETNWSEETKAAMEQFWETKEAHIDALLYGEDNVNGGIAQ